jgi:hypothetical protein
MPVYPGSFSAMLQHGAIFLWRVLSSYTDSIGDTILGYFAPAMVFVLASIFKHSGNSWRPSVLLDAIRKGLQENGRPLVKAVLWIYLPIFGCALAREVWKDHRSLVLSRSEGETKNAKLSNEIEELQARLKAKAFTPTFTDHSFGVVVNGVRAFMAFRRSIGLDATCKILTTEPDNTVGSDIGNISYTIISVGVLGSNYPNGNLANIGIKDEDREAQSRKGEISGTVVLHALPETNGAIKLADDLSTMFPVKRSYTFPVPVNPSDNVIWLQFGPNMKWNAER